MPYTLYDFHSRFIIFVASCNILRENPLLGTVHVSPPPPVDKNLQSSREILEKGRGKKIHKEQSLQVLRFIADFPILQSCQSTAVPEGDYVQKPHGLSHHASSDDVTRDLCAAACCLQNSWRQNPSFLILNSWQDLGSDIVWYSLLSASNKETGGIQWGMLLFLSSVPCARSCY